MRPAIVIATVIVAISSPTIVASAGDAYDNQIEMTSMLFSGTPAKLRELCRALGGTYTEQGQKAKCERGATSMALISSGDDVVLAIVAYPATPKDIRGLRKKAVEMLGKPNKKEEKELTWFLKNGVFASTVYDDEHSMFLLGHVESRPDPG